MSLLPILLVGDGQEGLIALIITGITLLLTGWLLLSMQQILRIDEKGVSYKHSPFHRKFQMIPWTDIQDCKVIKINAFSDFGGWSIRVTGKKEGDIMEGACGLSLKTKAKKLTFVSIIDNIAIKKVINQHNR